MDDYTTNEQGNEPFLNWVFPEYEIGQRGNSWYIWFGIIIALLISTAILSDNFLFAVILLLFSVILFLQNWRRPKKIEITISPIGVQIGDTLHEMRDIDEFWIAYDPPYVEKVYFAFASPIRPHMGVPLEGQNPLQVRELLLQYVPENLEREEELTSDSIARLLKI